jgi:hypothetical protein
MKGKEIDVINKMCCDSFFLIGVKDNQLNVPHIGKYLHIQVVHINSTQCTSTLRLFFVFPLTEKPSVEGNTTKTGMGHA